MEGRKWLKVEEMKGRKWLRGSDEEDKPLPKFVQQFQSFQYLALRRARFPDLRFGLLNERKGRWRDLVGSLGRRMDLLTFRFNGLYLDPGVARGAEVQSSVDVRYSLKLVQRNSKVSS